MNIKRLKENNFGWRIKLVHRKGMDLSIIHENNHLKYWKESKRQGHNVFIDIKYLKELRDFIEDIIFLEKIKNELKPSQRY